MKLKSITYLIDKAKVAFVRFPLVILCSLLATCTAYYLIDNSAFLTNVYPYGNFMLCCGLGISLFFCIRILGERYKLGVNYQLISSVIVCFILGLIYYSLPSHKKLMVNAQPYIHFLIYSLIGHLLVAIIPYIKTKEINGFWNYNKELFIRFCTSVLYSGVLFFGLAMALVALHLLFDFDFSEKAYFIVFVTIAFLFNTWFFVSGIPKNFKELEEQNYYPKELKIFTQYVLLPLLTIYLVILYAYGTKIITTWDWPRGIVSYLVICVSVVGIFTFLLMYPYSKMKGSQWIKHFTKGYYFLLIPLTGLLFYAISIRINDYGITINRYIIVALGVWLLCTSIVMLLKTNIKFIPISLIVVLLFMSFGPFNMFKIAQKGQVNRLINILTRNDLIENEKFKDEVTWRAESIPTLVSDNKNTNRKALNEKDFNNVSSILNYLEDYHKMDDLNNLFKQDLKAIVQKSVEEEHYVNIANIYIKTMGIQKIAHESEKRISYSTDNEAVINIKGFDYIIDFGIRSFHDSYTKEVVIEDEVLSYRISKNHLILDYADEELIFDLEKLLTKLKNKYGLNNRWELDSSDLEIFENSESISTKLGISNISFKISNEEIKIDNIKSKLYLKEK